MGDPALVACTAFAALALALAGVSLTRGTPRTLREAHEMSLRALTETQAAAAKVDAALESIELERDAIRRNRARLSAAESRSGARESQDTGPPEGSDRASLVDHYRRSSGLASGGWSNGG